ncbi:MAG: hypothetical protein EXS15_06180 [Phycisphaerales bacterium]|nr:hypothetical protein [Phycisphaerales bacterium]
MTPPDPTLLSPVHSGRRRWMLAIAVTVVALLGAVVALLPVLLSSSIGRSVALHFAAPHVRGEISLAELSLSWSGPQSISGLTITGADGASIAVDVTAQNGLIRLVRGSEPPRVTLRGSITTVYRVDGTTSLREIFVDPAAPAPIPVEQVNTAVAERGRTLEQQLNGFRIEIAGLSVKATSSASGQVNSLSDITGVLSVDGGEVRIDLSAGTHVGSKSGSLSVKGSVDELFGSDGSIDFAQASVDVNVQASALVLPATDDALEFSELSFAITSKKVASGVAVDGKTTIQLATGESARVSVRLDAANPMDEKLRTLAGEIVVDNLPTTALRPWLPATILATRDIGPSLTVRASFEGRSGSVEVAASKVGLTARGALDEEGRLLTLDEFNVHATVDPALVAASIDIESPVVVTVVGSAIALPLSSDSPATRWQGAAGSIAITLAPATVRLSSVTQEKHATTLAVGATRVQLSCRDLSTALQLQVDSSVDGVPLQVVQTITNLSDSTGFALHAAHARGTIHLDASTLATASWLPINLKETLASCNISSIAAQIDNDGGFDAGNATISLQLSEARIATSCSWSNESLSTGAISVAVTVSPAVLAKYAPPSVATAGASNLAVLIAPAVLSFQELRVGRIVPAKVVASISSDRIEIARCPGLTHGVTLAQLKTTVTLTTRADGTISGIDASLGARVFDGAADAGTISATFATADDSAESWRSTADITVPAGETLSKVIDAGELTPMLAGPGRVRATFNRTARGDSFTANSTLPRCTLTGAGELTPSGFELRKTTATLDVPAALLRLGSGPSIIGSVDIDTFKWNGKAEDASAVMTAVIEPGSCSLPGRPPIAFEQLNVTISSPRLSDRAKASVAGSFTVGTAAAGALALSIDAKGKLNSLLGATGEPLVLSDSHISIKAPGPLALALAQWAHGTDSAPLAVTQLGDIAAEIQITALALGNADLESGSIDASIALAPTSVTPAGKSKLTVGATTVSVRSQQLARALTASVRGTVQANESAASALSLSVDATGDLRALFGASDQPLTLRESQVQLQAPGSLVLALVDWLQETQDATAALTRVGDVNATLAINALTLPSSGISNAAIDAALTLAALDIEPKGMPTFSVAQTKVTLQSSRVADSVALTLTSGGMRGGTIAATASGVRLVTATGAFNPRAAAWTAHALLQGVATAMIDAVAGQGGQLVEALGPTVDATVDTTLVANAHGVEETRIAATLKSQYLDVAVPSLLLSNGKAIVTPANPLRCTFTLNSALRRRILEPVSPVLADIRTAPPIVVTLSQAAYPLDGNLAGLDLDARIEIGNVEIVRSNQVLGVLLLAQQAKSETIPAEINPLLLTVRGGQLTYGDFVIHAGKLGNQWQQTLKLSGDINLVRTPPYANAITCRYPLASLARSVGGASGALSATMVKLSEAIAELPIDPGELVQADITLSGPLGEVNGKKEPLASKVKLVFDASAINVKQIEKGIKDIGGAIDKLKGLFGK